MHSKGFTLIELLVVIVIIGILAGIGIASFGGNTDKALVSRGLNLEREIHQLSGIDTKARWLMESGSGTSVSDVSGHENTATLVGNTTWDTTDTPSDNNSSNSASLVFDGSGDYLEIPDSTNLRVTQNVTISAWIKPEICVYPGNSYAGIVAKGNNPRSYSLYTYQPSGNDCRLHFSVSKQGQATPSFGSVSSATGPFIKLNQWNHVAVVAKTGPSGGSHTYFINGVKAGEQTWSDFTSLAGSDDTQTTLIGTTHEGIVRSFKGKITRVSIYGEAFSSSQINRLLYAAKVSDDNQY